MLTAVSRWPTTAARGLAAAWHQAPTSDGQWLRGCADLVRLGVLCAAALFFVAGDGDDALKAILVMAPSLAARLLRVNPALDLVFTLALAVEGIRGGGAVPWIAAGDTLPHILLPLLSGPILYAGLVRLGALKEPPGRPCARSLIASAMATAACVIALGAAWELIEWVADTAVETNYSQGYRDSIEDLVNDSIGAVGGGILVGVWLWMAGRTPRLRPIVDASQGPG